MKNEWTEDGTTTTTTIARRPREATAGDYTYYEKKNYFFSHIHNVGIYEQINQLKIHFISSQ